MTNKYTFDRPQQMPDGDGSIQGVPFTSYIRRNGENFGIIKGKTYQECFDRTMRVVNFLKKENV